MPRLRYELFLRGSASLSEEVLSSIGAGVEQLGSGTVILEPFRTEDGRLDGVDIGISPEEADSAQILCDVAFRLAAEHGFTVFDPQLGRTVTEGDDDLIRQGFAQSSAFAMAAPITPLEESPSLSPTLRLWLIVIGLGFLFFILARSLRCVSG
jgi:hypothetical protein